MYTLNIFHDTLYVVFSSMFAGKYQTAFTYAMIIKDIIDENLLYMFFPYIEWFYSAYLHVYIRFGKWDEIISDDIIQNNKYAIIRTFQRYAKTIAHAVKGDINESEKELNFFIEERNNVSRLAIIGNNPANDVLDIGYYMAYGELLYRKKDFDNAFKNLRHSLKLYSELKFSEPWDWMQPPHHELGALLLEQGYIDDSIEIYLKDLNIYPDNIWSLIGLEECYTKLRLKLIDDKNHSELEKLDNRLN